MGQYWIPVNLDKKEFIHPHKLGCGLKLWEQIANHPSTGVALLILTAAMPERRGGGDLDLPQEDDSLPGMVAETLNISYAQIAKRTIGRWAGDRIAIIGHYAERTDLPEQDNADLIYTLCGDDSHRLNAIVWYRGKAREIPARAKEYLDKAERLEELECYRDITDDVAAVIEHELGGKFIGEGWKDWKPNS